MTLLVLITYCTVRRKEEEEEAVSSCRTLRNEVPAVCARAGQMFALRMQLIEQHRTSQNTITVLGMHYVLYEC